VSRLGRRVARRAEAALASLPSSFTKPERLVDLGIALGPTAYCGAARASD
jgi:hypothetical protein